MFPALASVLCVVGFAPGPVSWAPPSSVASGRVVLDAGQEGVLWLRRSPAQGSGYALRAADGRLAWTRAHLGEVVSLGAPARLRSRGGLVLDAVASGSTLLGVARDALGRVLAVVHASDPFFEGPDGPPCQEPPPLVGAMVRASLARGPALSWLSPALREALSPEGSGRDFERFSLPEGAALDLACRGFEPRALRRSQAPLPPPGELVGSYKPPDALQAALESFHHHHPIQTELAVLGTSWQGRPIAALAIRVAGPRAPAILLDGSHHGNEPLSTEAVLDAALALLEGPPAVRALAGHFTVYALPQLNPDGAFVALVGRDNSGRKNGRDHDANGRRDTDEGVDLNRNYPYRWAALEGRGGRPWRAHPFYRGPAPASEPETRALMRLAHHVHFALGVSYHTGSVAILAPYTTEGARDPEPWLAGALAQAVSRGLPPHPSGDAWELRRNLYPVDGTSQDWLFHAHGTTALLVELADTGPRPMATRRAILGAGRAAWVGLAEAWLGARRVRGTLRDLQGAPIAAQVRIPGVTTHEGERWESRCTDGAFDRLLPEPGPTQIEIQRPDGSWMTVPLPAGVRQPVVEVVLPEIVPESARCPLPDLGVSQ